MKDLIWIIVLETLALGGLVFVLWRRRRRPAVQPESGSQGARRRGRARALREMRNLAALPCAAFERAAVRTGAAHAF